MREIGFNKIGFNVLADTHNMSYALSLKNWQLDKEKSYKIWANNVSKYQGLNAVKITLLFIAAE